MSNHRKEFLEGLSQDFERLREDPEAWKNYVEEMTLLDNTNLDFLMNSPLRNSGIDLSRSKAADARATIDFEKEYKDDEKCNSIVV